MRQSTATRLEAFLRSRTTRERSRTLPGPKESPNEPEAGTNLAKAEKEGPRDSSKLLQTNRSFAATRKDTKLLKRAFGSYEYEYQFTQCNKVPTVRLQYSYCTSFIPLSDPMPPASQPGLLVSLCGGVSRVFLAFSSRHGQQAMRVSALVPGGNGRYLYHCTTTRFTPLRHDRPPGSALSGRAPLQGVQRA